MGEILVDDGAIPVGFIAFLVANSSADNRLLATH